jgi:hypothetical protein
MKRLPVALATLNPEKFDPGWRAASVVRACSIAEVQPFIQAHYLRKRPAIVLLCLRLEVLGLPVGAIVFAMPPREADTRYGGKVWELARLFVEDFVPRNVETFLISRAIRYIRQQHRDVQFLLSYADPSAGHRGHIYIAGSWKRDGRTDQERKTPRCDYVDERTGKKYGRKGNMPQGAVVVRVPRVSKFRYVFALK